MTEMESLLILMVVIWVAGKIFRFLSLPVLFGELLGGFLVGPLVFGVIPVHSEVIEVLAELGIFFLALHTGLETNPQQLLKSSKKSFIIAVGGLSLPFFLILAAALSFGFSNYQALFVATGLSVTAIEISVRVFKDCGKHNSALARTVLGAAVISDIVVLILFSLILKVVEFGAVGFGDVLLILLRVSGFFAVVIYGGFKLQKYTNHLFKDKGFTLTLIVALALGLIAEEIGMHMVIGAFLAGLFIHQEVLDEKIFRKIEDRVFGLSYSFLGPVFFATLAFNLDFIALYSRPWLFVVLFAIAFLAKFIGSGIMARILNYSREKTVVIGLAMNSRGVVDLIIASIGLSLGIIDRDLFSVMVLISFLATFVAIFGIRPLKKYI